MYRSALASMLEIFARKRAAGAIPMATDLPEDDEIPELGEAEAVPANDTQTIFFKILHLNPSALKHLKFDSLSERGLRTGDMAVTLHSFRGGQVRAEPERRGAGMLSFN